MYRKILLPTDGSELCDRAVEAGIELAKSLGSEVVGFHATPLTTHVMYSHVGPSDILVEQLRRDFQDRGSRLMERIQDRANAEGVLNEALIVADDHPWQAIIAAAKESGCDLIVMASHGRRGLAALILGSETVKVLTHTEIPVLVYR